MPIVVMKEGVKESSLKRSRQHDLPTPESPIRSSLICVCKGLVVGLDISELRPYEKVIISSASHDGEGIEVVEVDEGV